LEGIRLLSIDVFCSVFTPLFGLVFQNLALKKAYEVPTVKFQFEREQTKTVTKETLDDHGVPTGHSVETSTYLKDCEVALKTFAHSSDEDGEHWLEALRMVQKELAVEWKKAEQAKVNDATALFQAIDVG